MNQNLIGFPEQKLIKVFEELGEPLYRVRQVLTWVYHYRIKDFAEMTNLSKALRAKLGEIFHISLPRIKKKDLSRDGTIKYLFKLTDGHLIESVWMPSETRRTLCVSSQVGCRLNCSFCMTATMGLQRNLESSEIIGQIMAVNEDLQEEESVSNIVLMGMGEPLDNYASLVDAVRLMVSPEAMKISTRKVTVSTSGLVDKIKQFQEEDLHVNLAISLNATDNATRDILIPINKKYPIEVLLECLRNYPLKPQRRLTFEYILLKGINDSREDAERLVELLKGIPCKINLIPFNPFEPSQYQPPSEEAVSDFQNHLIEQNYTTFVRKNRGADIMGACGQLAVNSLPQTAPA